MKQFITLFSLAGILTACHSSTEKPIASEAKMVSVSDSAEYADFQQWKHERAMETKLAEEKQSAKPVVIYVKQAPAKTIVKTIERSNEAVPATTTSTPQTQTKKRMSAATKGAIIGAGAGAVTGAIVAKKNRALGAVIGGVAGGGVGFGIGKAIDKKHESNTAMFTGF